jgi:hypothetical protein
MKKIESYETCRESDSERASAGPPLRESFPAVNACYWDQRRMGAAHDELVGLVVDRPWYPAFAEVLPLASMIDRVLALPGQPGRGFGSLIISMTREVGTKGMLPVVLVTDDRVVLLRVPVE